MFSSVVITDTILGHCWKSCTFSYAYDNELKQNRRKPRTEEKLEEEQQE